MKPKYEEVRRMIMLAVESWTGFLNTLNSPLYSKSHLPDERFFEQVFEDSYRNDEIREALVLISAFWDRLSEKVFALGTIGLTFNNPHAEFERILRSFYLDHKECARLVVGVVVPIDSIELPIMTREFRCQQAKLPSAYPLTEDGTLEAVAEYDQKMLGTLCVSDPLIKAGIELCLLNRGFTL